MTTIQVKRGKAANKAAFTPKLGEPIFTVDTHELYIGDGTTLGGIPVGTVKPKNPVQGQLAVFSDSTGKEIESLDKTALLANHATVTYVNTSLATKVTKGDVVDEATHAENASKLGNREAVDYLTVDTLTDSYQEDDSTKVTTARGVKSFYDYVAGLITAISKRLSTTEQHLSNLPKKISAGTAAPTGGTDGDVYIQYK